MESPRSTSNVAKAPPKIPTNILYNSSMLNHNR